MKTLAFILLVPFTVFLTETATFPLEENIACTKKSCMQKIQQQECPSKKECPSKRKKEEKSPEKCKNTSACTICPVCFIFTFQPLYELSLKYSLFQKNYQQINTGYLSSYISPVWKPPNGFFHNSQEI